MKITKEQFKNIVREVMTEESEYQQFFAKALEKTGKSIPDMSDEEKKEFFNKIDSAWQGKGEKKNEGNAFGAAVTAAKQKGEDEFEVGGEKFKVEEDFKAVVGKKVYSDGKGKLFFGYEKEDDSVHLVDYKTWKNLTAKNLSNEFMANRLINAIVKGQKQFNKKVDYNMWSKKTNPSFEQRMDWFIKNGWISNINKGGIKESLESVNEASKPTIKVVTKLKNEQGIQIVVVKTTKGETEYGGFVVRGKLQKVIPVGANKTKEDVKKRALQIWDEFGKQLGETKSVNEKSSDPFLDYTSSKNTKGSKTRVDRVAKYGNYKFEFDDKSFIVKLFYNGKLVSYGYPDWSTGGYMMNHLSWGTREKKFKSLEDIIKYFKSNKITTDGLNEASKPTINELKKLPSGNFSIKVGYPTFADYEKKAKVGDTILKYDKRGGMIKSFVKGSELDKNAEKYLDKVNNITGGVVFLSKKGMKGVAQVPDYEKKEVGVLVLESKSVNEEKYTVIDPKGNSLGTAEKNQVVMAAKKKGGEKTGHFVVSAKNALKARRALEKFKGDFKNPKLKDIMASLYESVKK